MSKKSDIPTYPIQFDNRRMSQCRCYSCNTIGCIRWDVRGAGDGVIEALGWCLLDEEENRWLCGDCHEKMEEQGEVDIVAGKTVSNRFGIPVASQVLSEPRSTFWTQKVTNAPTPFDDITAKGQIDV